jgi:hypothetical protein
LISCFLRAGTYHCDEDDDDDDITFYLQYTVSASQHFETDKTVSLAVGQNDDSHSYSFTSCGETTRSWNMNQLKNPTTCLIPVRTNTKAYPR